MKSSSIIAIFLFVGLLVIPCHCKDALTANDKTAVLPSEMQSKIETSFKPNNATNANPKTSTPISTTKDFDTSTVTDTINTTTKSPDTTTNAPSNSTTTAKPTASTTTPTTTTSTTTTPTTTIPTTTTPTTTKPTTASPNITTTTAAPDTTTLTPNTTTVVPPPSPKPPCGHFDGPSFIGGIVLTLGLLAIGIVAYKFYKARNERNYHTL